MTIPQALQAVRSLQHWLESQVIGQPELVQRLLIALLADGHLLVEGPPGLAKTRAVKSLAAGLEASFHRIQFTPDLLPADITGSDIYQAADGQFRFQPGPIFHNLVLADEINRAPAKVQAALLEAMAERQVSIGLHSHPLPALFLVMATQNPLEQAGTYPLPQAQLDRFLLHRVVRYPDATAEHTILALARAESRGDNSAPAALSQEQVMLARREVLALHLAPAVEQYLVQLVIATREPRRIDPEFADWLLLGASPRGSIALERCARAHAWLAGRDFVSPDDVRAMAADVLRHRLHLSFEAQAAGVDADQAVARLLDRVPVG